MKKRDVIKYAVLWGALIILIIFLLILKGGLTGYAIFEDSGSGFGNGTYISTVFNGSGIILNAGNLTGTYISQIFNAGSDSVWNNLSYVSNTPTLNSLFCVDEGGDVYKSIDSGVNWVLSKENYGRTTDTVDLFSDGNYLYIITESNKEVWRSEEGVDWTVVNSSFTTYGLKEGISDNTGRLYVATGPGSVYESLDYGITWSEKGDLNAGKTEDPKGIDANSTDSIFAVDEKGRVEVSGDRGVTWIEMTGGYGGGSATDALQLDGNNDIYILNNKQVYKSNDSGINWNVINDSFTPYVNDGCRMFIDNNDEFFILDCTGRVFKSDNYGIDWQEIGDCNDAATNDAKGITEMIQSTNLSFQVRNCSQLDCSDDVWQTLDLDNLNLVGQYFQYKIDFISYDSSITPILESIAIDYSVLNTAPSIYITNPQQGSTYGYNESIALDFIASDNDNNIDSCWYTLNSGNNIDLTNCANTTINIPEGINIIIIYINDTNGEQSNDSVTFNVQVGAPTITLTSPINVYLNYNNVEFDYTPTDIDLDYCELWGDFNGEFALNQTDSSPTSGSVNTFTLNLSDNAYLWNIKCTDNLGNSAFNGNKTFYVDTIAPAINITQPKGIKTSRTITSGWNILDNSPTNCLYNVYRGENLEISNTSVICSLNTSNFEVTVNANLVFNLYVNDSAGNSNFANSSFSVDTSITPPNGGGGDSGGGSSEGRGGSLVTVAELNMTGKLEVSKIGNIVAKKGDKKTISLNIKNSGKKFLNNCRLIANGEVNPWIYSTQIKGIAPGENINLAFDLNIPEEIEPKDYSGEIEIKCTETSNMQNIIISISDALSLIKIKDIIHEGKFLNVTYDFDSTNLIGESVAVNIWILDENEIEINKVQDVFNINKDGIIKRNLKIEIGKITGIYYVYFALSSEPEEFIKQSVVLGKSGSTGLAVLDTVNSKLGAYIIFLLIIFAGIFLIIRKHGKTSHPKNKWLLRKVKKRDKT